MSNKNKRSEEYSKLLKKKEWKQKRLEILNRDDFTCQDCLRKDIGGKNLQVHHNYYIFGKLPWEYNDDAYITLCRYCHMKEHNMVSGKYDVEKDYKELEDKKPIKILEIKHQDIKSTKKKKKNKKDKKKEKLTYAQKKAVKYVKKIKLNSRDKKLQKKYDDLNKKL
jgi:hypothetical protein